ncbi:hypothetical protein EV421DRAFT_1899472 [Armillaria borealis]|uniref:Retrovirus-related Pol polyprotein from transposon TNT 1-94-like beta-barrel domain-containing protein n=1 Tax=Armillaria borealis TaxID=47425 RepID=A0AA39MWT4_9AGAR|nr:hypothetical protein EV421DRAFT_1899472 [Armillaria borealis]
MAPPPLPPPPPPPLPPAPPPPPLPPLSPNYVQNNIPAQNNNNLQNQPLPITYNYYNYVSPSSTHIKTPMMTSIPELMGRNSWAMWLHGVKSVAVVNRILPHILDKPPPGMVLQNPLRQAMYPPPITQWSTPQEWEAYNAWQCKDAAMMHIITLRLSSEVSAVLPMIDDFASADQGMMAHQMLSILQKHFEMQNIVKYAQKWRSTILALRVENYPIIYMETILNFVWNLPEDDCGWYMALKQEVTRDCSLAFDCINFIYFESILTRVVDLDTQWKLNHHLQHSLPENDVASDEEVYAAITKVPSETSCNIDTYNTDELFVCSSAITLSPLLSASTHYLDVMNEKAYILLAQMIKILLDSGCTAHIFKEQKFFWTYNEDQAIDVKTANCGVLSTKARGEIHIRVKCISGTHMVVSLMDCLHAPEVPMNLVSVSALME